MISDLFLMCKTKKAWQKIDIGLDKLIIFISEILILFSSSWQNKWNTTYNEEYNFFLLHVYSLFTQNLNFLIEKLLQPLINNRKQWMCKVFTNQKLNTNLNTNLEGDDIYSWMLEVGIYHSIKGALISFIKQLGQ